MIADMHRDRQWIIRFVFIGAALLLIVTAAYLQLIDRTFSESADATAIQKNTIYPARGLLYERNGKELLIYNNPTYDLMVTYNQVDWENIDIQELCDLLDVNRNTFEQALRKDFKDKRYSKSVPFVVVSKISAKVYARLQESLYKFPGFSVQLRTARSYPHEQAAHVLGYIKEVDPNDIKKNPTVYQMGDYIGASGLEQSYESELRGIKGIEFMLKDNLGRDVGPYKDGKLDSIPLPGKDIITSIDLELQAYGELLMQNKVGSIVAIEPSTGEILAMVSSPTYNPNLLTLNQKRGEEYSKLLNDPNKPLLDRSVQAMYPPGSLFKPVVALIAMQEGLLKPDRTIGCGGAYFLGGQRLTGCHGHATCTSVASALQHSCNAYFVTVFREIVDSRGFYNPQAGLNVFNGYLDKFGLGKTLGVDFPNEKRGNYPTTAFYDTLFNRQQPGQKWNSVWIRSVAIGQGEMLLTTLQMANLGAAIANRGYYVTPHLIRSYKDRSLEIPEKYQRKNYVGIDAIHFPPVIDGMERAVTGGTARIAFMPDISICGKTGTAENPHGDDHSIFFGFAPKDNPTIAVAVYVEHGVWGARYAAPIASLIIEKYIHRKISEPRKFLEERMIKADLIHKPKTQP